MIRAYLRHRRPVLLLYLGVAVLFPLVQYLAHGDPSPALYTLLMLTFLMILCGAGDFIAFYRRLRNLQDVAQGLPESLEALMEPSGPISSAYYDIVEQLDTIQTQQKHQLSSQHTEQLDYYTLWVHQIKTPIAAMRLALEGDAPQDVLVRELLSVERYADMALQYVKLDSLAGDLILQPVQLAPVVSACVKKYAPLFIAGKLSVAIEGTEQTVLTDEKWLAFILEQLLSNAIKYTHKGGITITGGEGTLTMADTGIGIRPEDLPRIFHKGYTGLNGRMDKRASGIGLYMSKRVADTLSIRIQAKSTPGRGTSMTLTFPAMDAYIE